MEGRPRVGQTYRCSVCRLDLRFNEQGDRMEIAPFESDHAVAPEPPRGSRTIPPPLKLPKPPPLTVKRPTIPKPPRLTAPRPPKRRLPPKPPKRG